MALTYSQKLEAVRAANDALNAAHADLLDPSTGEAIGVDETVIDSVGKYSYTNEGGKLARKRVKIVQPPKVV